MDYRASTSYKPLDDFDMSKNIKTVFDYINKSEQPQEGVPEPVQGELNLWSTRLQRLSMKIHKGATDEGTRESLLLLSGMLGKVGSIHWVVAGAYMLAVVLQNVADMEANTAECVELLNSLKFFANNVYEFQQQTEEDNPQKKEMVEKAVALIVKGTTTCYKYMQEKKCLRFIRASIWKNKLHGHQVYLTRRYQELNLAVNINIASKVRGPYKQQRPVYPASVGLAEREKEVVELLAFGNQKSTLAVILHGMGGIGKSTLGEAVFARLVTDNIVKVEDSCKIHLELEEEKNNVTEVQQQILDKIIGRSSDKIGDYEQGRYFLETLFQQKKVNGHRRIFLYIDNAPSASFLEKLLPQKDCLPGGSRLLVTTRIQNICSVLQGDNNLINSYKNYEVEVLLPEQAMVFLRQRIGRKISEKSMHNVQKVCGGLPLALEVAAGYIKEHKFPEKACAHVVVAMKSGDGLSGVENDRLMRCLHLMIEELDTKLRDAFGAVVNFCEFHSGIPWEVVELIVGDHEMEVLEQRALVSRNICYLWQIPSVYINHLYWKADAFGQFNVHLVGVHDHLIAVGHKLCLPHLNGYTKGTSLSEILMFKKEYLKKVECVSVHGRNEEKVQTEELEEPLCNLRILELKGVTLKGQSKHKKLQYLQCGSRYESSFETDISGFSSLMVLHIHLSVTTKLHNCKFPDSLKSLTMDFSGGLAVLLPSMFSNLKNSLTMLRLVDVDFSPLLPDLCTFTNLEILVLDGKYWSSKQEPEGEDMDQFCSSLLRRLDLRIENYCFAKFRLGQMIYLEDLSLDSWRGLKYICDSVRGLESLTRLSIEWATELVALPNDLESLNSLTVLTLKSCDRLTRLPDSLTRLKSLITLELLFCNGLVSLPSEMGELSTLQKLSICGCSRVTNLPESVTRLTSLTTLHLECENLEQLPADLGALAALQNFWLTACDQLTELPESLTRLTSLTDIRIHRCRDLGSLPSDLGKLTSLQSLVVTGCYRLAQLPESLGKLTSLASLDLTDCAGLGSISSAVGELRSLQTLKLNGCKGVTVLPDSLTGLTSLRCLELYDCDGLVRLPSELGELRSLERFGLCRCRALTELPDSFTRLTSLRLLHMEGCDGLTSLPSDLRPLRSLEYVKFTGCTRLTRVPDTLRKREIADDWWTNQV